MTKEKQETQDAPMRHETKAQHEARCKEFFVRGRPVRLSDHTKGTFIKLGKTNGTAIVLNSSGRQTSVTREGLIADNLPRMIDARATT